MSKIMRKMSENDIMQQIKQISSGKDLESKYDALAICHSGRLLAGIQICNLLKSWMPDITLPA